LIIQAEISSSGNTLDFKIRNRVGENPEMDPGREPGLGLENVRKRLEINYPGLYTLANEHSGGWYTAHLIIKNLNADHETETDPVPDRR
jgi:hypothetical protein